MKSKLGEYSVWVQDKPSTEHNYRWAQPHLALTVTTSTTRLLMVGSRTEYIGQ